MELAHRQAGATRIIAYFVQADHPVKAIEGSVLDALSHHRRCELLKAQKELALELSGNPKRQDVGNEIKQTGIQVWTALLCPGHGLVDPVTVFIGDLHWLGDDIGSIDGKTRRNLAKRSPNFSPGIVAAVAVVFAYLHKQVCQTIDVAAQSLMEHIQFLFVRYFCKLDWLAGEVAVNTRLALASLRRGPGGCCIRS